MPKSLIITALLLVLILIIVSAYLRLSNAGLGCSPWPDCYGHIGTHQESQPNPIQLTPDKEYADRLVRDISNPETWATPIHRITASVLAIIIFIIAIQATLQRRQGAPLATIYSLLAITLFLSILGISSGGLHLPAITLGNLIGGFAMLALLWFLYLGGLDNPEHNTVPSPHSSSLSHWNRIGLAVVTLQIILGGLTSTHFAALACTSFPDCNGEWLPDQSLWSTLNIFAFVGIDEAGTVIAHAGQQAIHTLHRLGAWVTTILVASICIMALRSDRRYRIPTVITLLLLIAEVALGIINVLYALPITLVVAHNGLAALLLLGLLTLQYRINSTPT